MDDRPRLGLPAVALAVGGVLAGHWLTYLVVRPDQHERTALLADTGHGYLSAAFQMAWLLGLVAVGAVVVRRLAGPEEHLHPRRLALHLSAFQLGAFVLLETAERAVHGSFAGLAVVCLVGAGVQIVVSAAVACIIAVLARLGESIVSAFGRTPDLALGTGAFGVPTGPSSGLGASAVAATDIRGPPLLGR